MMPNPPIWMRASVNISPSGVKVLAKSTAFRPVTHTALVLVNRASVKPVSYTHLTLPTKA